MREIDLDFVTKILEEAFKNPATIAGEVGANIAGIVLALTGNISGAAGVIGFDKSIGKSSAKGGLWTYKKLKTVRHSEMVTYNINTDTAIQQTLNFLTENGTPLSSDLESSSKFIVGLIGSGYGNLNPVCMCFEFYAVDSTTTTIEIASYAKEGLINQKSAEKAILKLTYFFNQL